MPQPLRAHWDALDEEVKWLHGRWKIFRQLFGTSPDRIELLNRSAAAFFRIIQDVLMDSVQLTLSKLADRSQTAGRQNLTLDRLVADINSLGDTALSSELNEILTEYRDRCAQMKNRRNKQLAHYDFDTLLNAKSTPIPGPSREEIENGLEALRRFMNTLQRKFTEAETAYHRIVLTTDGELLALVLKRGLRYQELVDRGVVSWDDLRQHGSEDHP